MQDVLMQLSTSVTAFLPGLIGAIVLLIVGWVVAAIVRFVVVRVGRAAHFDQRLHSRGIVATLGDVLFWLVFLLFLPGILQALGLVGILLPVQTLLNQFLGFLPNLFAAIVISVVGWFVAGLLRRIVTELAPAIGVDRFAERVGLQLGQQRLSGLLGLVVYVLALIPVLTAALNALQLPAVTQPISAMLGIMLAAVPNIFAAAVLIGIAVFIGRLVARLASSLLEGVGFDTLPARLGLRVASTPGGRTPATLVGGFVCCAVVFFAALEALRLLGFIALAALLSQLIVLVGQILLGLAIIAIGLYLANSAARAIASNGMQQAGLLATAARMAILVLAGAVALRQMGIANEIIILAFGLLMGAIAVAAALAFGLGGRESAGRLVERWRQDLESGKEVVPAVATVPTMPAPVPTPIPVVASVDAERTKQLEQFISGIRRPVAQLADVQQQLNASGSFNPNQQELLVRLGSLTYFISQALGVRVGHTPHS